MTIPETFHFLRPAWLLAAALIPVVVWVARRRRQSAGPWQRICDASLLPHLIVDRPGRGSRGPAVLLCVGWLAATVALAGPTWEERPQPAYGEPTDTVAVLSLAPSLLEKDVAPSRLARARFELHDLLEQAEGTVGLVIFAEDAYPVTPLTDDARVVTEMLPILEPRLMPGRGARLDRGIDEAATLLDNAGANAGRIDVVTDGPGQQPAEAIAAAGRARRAGHVVSVLSLTSALTSESTSETDALREVANAGGGALVSLRPDDADVRALLAAGSTGPGTLDGLRRSAVDADVWRDMGPWLVLIPLLFAPLAFRRGWAGALLALLLVGTTGGDAHAELMDWWQRPDQQGASAFEDGEHTRAAEQFEDPEWQSVARYRDGDYPGAIETLQDLDTPRARYNLGNALAQAGRLEEAVAAYEEALAIEPDHDDAEHNRDLVRKLLEQQQQEQQQQEQPRQQPQSEGGQGDESDDSSGEGQSGSEDSDEASGSDGGGDAESQEDGSAPPEGGSSDASPTQGGDRESDSGESKSADGAQTDPSDEGPGEPSGSVAQGEGSETGEGAANAAPGGEEQPAPSEDPAAPRSADSPESLAAGSPEPGRDRTPGTDPPDEGSSDSQLANAAGEAREADRTDHESARGSARGPMSERDQQIEHMLSRIPDDPGALLAEKLRRRYAEKHGLSRAARGGRR